MIVHNVDIGVRLLFMISMHKKDYYSWYGCYGENTVNADSAFYDL